VIHCVHGRVSHVHANRVRPSEASTTKAIAATERGLQSRERLTDRQRADAGPVKALTDSELHELRKLLQRAMVDNSAQ
jgi:hypothetical protein